MNTNNLKNGFRYVNSFGIGVDRADRQGLDGDGGEWVATCHAHGTLVNAATKRELMTTSGVDFCDGCRDAEATAAIIEGGRETTERLQAEGVIETDAQVAFRVELTDEEAVRADRYARRQYAGLPVADGDHVAQGHTNYCLDFGHAVWVVDGIVLATCPRCGEVAEHDPAKVERVRDDLMMGAEGMARATGSVSASYQEGRFGVATWNRPGFGSRVQS